MARRRSHRVATGVSDAEDCTGGRTVLPLAVARCMRYQMAVKVTAALDVEHDRSVVILIICMLYIWGTRARQLDYPAKLTCFRFRRAGRAPAVAPEFLRGGRVSKAAVARHSASPAPCCAQRVIIILKFKHAGGCCCCVRNVMALAITFI